MGPYEKGLDTVSGPEPRSARAEILDRIDRALRDRPRPAGVVRDYRTAEFADPRSMDELVELLAERLGHYRASVRRCPADAVPTEIAAALKGRQALRVVAPPGLRAGWLDGADGVEVTVDEPPLAAADLDRLDGVVTTCAAAIAETGTIVLDGGDGQGRRAVSLVPDYHLVVVPIDRVVGTVPAAIARLDPTRPLTWISGPSATSDIELDRVEGVHGPRTLEVILAG